VTGDIAALAVRCGRSTIEQLEGASVDLGEASDMLGHAMASLRGHFAAALATTRASDATECRRHLEAAMVALQAEDALTQMLDDLQRRTQQIADVLRYVVTPRGDAVDAGPLGAGWAGRDELLARLRLAMVAMDAGIVRPGPVPRERADAGTVELF